MKDIISVDYELFSEDVNLIDFNSKHSLSDADVVIFRSVIDNSFITYSTYRGKKSFNLNDSTKIIECTKHWNKELNSFLEAGKNVFLFLTSKEEFYLDSGKRDTSGTGRNQKVTHLVDVYDNYRYLPIDIEVHNAEGKKVIGKNNLIKSFLNDFKDVLSYKTYIETKSTLIDILISNKTQDKIVSGVIKHKNGHIVLLPYIEPYFDDFYDEEDEFTEEGKNYQRRIIKNILEIDKAISSITEKSPKPSWLEQEQFHLKSAEELKKQINLNIESIKRIEEQNKELEVKKINEEILLDLIFETGKSLESAVIKALEILGFKAESYDDGVLELDQVIISPENYRYIGECEGKDNKAIDISKFRQLQDSLNEDFQREDVEEKAFGLLFGNPHRNLPIDERKEIFTIKCLKGADREKIGLIKTTDLFFICKYLTEHNNEDFKKKCREKIYKDLGRIVEFPKIPSK